MKKQVLFLVATAVMLVASTSVQAQSVSYPKFHMGIRGGLTVNTASVKGGGSADALAFPYGGIAVDFRVAPFPLYLETGVYYMNKGGEYKYVQYNGGYSFSDYTEKFDNHFINVPLLLCYHFYVNDKMAVQPFVGFVGGYLTESDNFGGAVRIGCGYNFGRLYANIGYDFGVTKDSKHGEDITNNTFFATLGFNFAGGR